MSYALKREGWHFRLQQWTFGDVPRMNNFCPFFWLTIFCIMASPFVGLTKSIIWLGRAFLVPLGYVLWPVIYLAGKFNLAFDSKYGTSRATAPEDMTPEQAYWLFDFIYSWATHPKYRHESYKFTLLKVHKQRQFRDRFNAWKDANDEWEDIIIEEQKKIEAVKMAMLAVKKQRKAKYMQIAHHTKTLILLPLGIALIYLSYFIGLVVLSMIENPMSFLIAMIAIAIGIVIIITIGITVRSLEDRGLAYKALDKTAGPIRRGFSEVFGFFKMNFDAFMKNYCPGVDWED